MGKATGVFVFCVAAVAIIAVSEVPVATDAFLEPFASHLIAKKMMLKQGFAAPSAPSGQTTQYIYYGGQYQHHPRPAPPQPQVSYPAYGPQTSSYPSYGPPAASYSGYSEQPAHYVKPAPAYGPQTSSYPAYGPQTSSYPSYGPPAAGYIGYSEQPAPVVIKPAPSYGSVTYVGYSEQPAPVVVKPAPSYGPPASYGGYPEQPAPVEKPTPAPPACPPASQPTAQVDFSNYAVHGGHGYGNNGGYGK